MIVEYSWASGYICEFDAFDFYLISNEGYEEESLYLIGRDSYKGGKLTALQIMEDDEGKYYCAFVKQVEQKHYQKIVDAKDGKIVTLLSDISMGLWCREKHKKINGITPRLKYFLQEEPLVKADKEGMSMEKGCLNFMVPNGNEVDVPGGGRAILRSIVKLKTPQI